MCNAYNHPMDCTCGFGGEGHLGVRGASYYSRITEKIALSEDELLLRDLKNRIDPNKYKSYIIPNAICPVCGESVFFFQSETGGRVFFDELGPPWPKHPCTDTRLVPKINLVEKVRRAKWMENGWSPFVLTDHSTYSNQILFSGILNESREKYKYLSGLKIQTNNNFVISPFKFFKFYGLRRFKIVFYSLSQEKAELVDGTIN